MKKQCIATVKAPSAIGPYSQGVRVGNLVFVSGQLPINLETGELVSDIKEATRESLENVKAILSDVGASMDSIVKTTVFLRDMNDFVAMNEVYATYFLTNPPARAAVQIAKLPKNAIVEIEAIAVVE